jgi:hypothetical protein
MKTIQIINLGEAVIDDEMYDNRFLWCSALHLVATH